ncbi:Eukaryotic translation initiation factor 3 subunit H [Plasmodiophora brassicae]|uniref:Eukaryotic translation initiation factor 3 subunit H n=1 Tax=Plasmodiophora brassicae TaxID=37360 RepID=A0A0G4J050_PLABS|nr:hypothetical protein PBRA_008320 [Plasmodiophora brassicae]SPQ95281.1 unnamed protein product [Plasmodiophora brassicae]
MVVDDRRGQAPGLDAVQLDGLVIIKIIKHARESLPEPVSGQLLGLDVSGKLEVTGCFPMPAPTPAPPAITRPHWAKDVKDDEENDDAAARDDAAFQLQMMKLLREVNVDCNSVGWYQSLSSGDMMHDADGASAWSSIIATQYDYQVSIPNSVVIVYDPFRTAYGTLAIKAYRLTNAFMAFYKAGDQTRDGFARHNIDSNRIFEEVPLKVHNSNLVHAFLYELRESGTVSCEFDRLSMSQHAILARDLKALGESVHGYAQEQSRYQFYQRNLARQKIAGSGAVPTAPSRLDAFLVTHTLRQICNQVNDLAATAYTRMYVAESLSAAHHNEPEHIAGAPSSVHASK